MHKGPLYRIYTPCAIAFVSPLPFTLLALCMTSDTRVAILHSCVFSQNSRRYCIFCIYIEGTDKVNTFLFFPVEAALRSELVFRYAEAMGIFRSLLDWQIYLMMDLMDYYWIAAIAAWSGAARICTQTRQDVCHHHRPNNSQTQ